MTEDDTHRRLKRGSFGDLAAALDIAWVQVVRESARCLNPGPRARDLWKTKQRQILADHKWTRREYDAIIMRCRK